MILLDAPITYFQAIVLGLLQGVTELFPISSLGHSVILPQLFGWNIHQNDDYFITFLVATHLATAIVLLLFFRRDWARIVRGLGRSLRDREIPEDDTDAKLAWLLSSGRSRPASSGWRSSTRCGACSPRRQSAAFFLTVNGVLLIGAEALRRRAPQPDDDDDARIAKRIRWRNAFVVGAAQALALIPGISRTGATMGGGLLVGLSHKDAARVRVPARDADHRRCGDAEAAGARSARRATASAGRRSSRRCARPRPPTSRCAS